VLLATTTIALLAIYSTAHQVIGCTEGYSYSLHLCVFLEADASILQRFRQDDRRSFQSGHLGIIDSFRANISGHDFDILRHSVARHMRSRDSDTREVSLARLPTIRDFPAVNAARIAAATYARYSGVTATARWPRHEAADVASALMRDLVAACRSSILSFNGRCGQRAPPGDAPTRPCDLASVLVRDRTA
jgi:hypothetical protein